MIWFTSDLHLWHANILIYQPNRLYQNIEEMNEGLIANWNSVVKSEDEIYCLGDFSFAGRSVELYSNRLNGKKYLIPGNHDPIHPYNKHQKKAIKRGEPDYWLNFYKTHNWEVLPITSTIEVPGVGAVNMSHMPYNTQDERYQKYTPLDDGKYLLHGHTHSQEKINGRQIHVGVDAWDCKPVSIDQIKELINGL